MTATWLNTGIDNKAQVVLGKVARSEFTVRLYVNNHTPAVADTLGSYTECTLVSYAAVPTVPANWTGSTSGGLATYVQATLTFSFAAYAGGTTIFGYYVTIPGPIGVLAALLSVPYAVPAGGGTLTLDITYQDQGF